MRVVAQYSLHLDLEAGEIANVLGKCIGAVEAWLDGKGELDESESADFKLKYSDGRTAHLNYDAWEAESASLHEWSLAEPAGSGEFQTSISIASSGRSIGVHCALRAGSTAAVVSPVSFDVHCPRAIGHLLDLGLDWHLGRSAVSGQSLRYRGTEGGENLARLLFDPTRDIPLILVSELEGFLLAPNLDQGLQKDLRGLAVVASADADASWTLTKKCGQQWSCYNGAVRVYWPGAQPSHDPLQHPLWTADRLLASGASHRDAAKRIRRQLRRQILGISAFTATAPPQIEAAKRAKREAALAERRTDKSTESWIRDLEQDNDRLSRELDEVKEERDHLSTDVANLKLQLEYAPTADTEVVAPEVLAPPQTVVEAVTRARGEFGDTLIFGTDVDAGATALASDAGPPEKVYRFLSMLSNLAIEMRKGPLGESLAAWLTKQGGTTTDEREGTRNNKSEMAKRTWDAGGSQVPFTLHMKPKESTSPDQCVRIYFRWDEDRNVVVVGWVGRHP